MKTLSGGIVLVSLIAGWGASSAGETRRPAQAYLARTFGLAAAELDDLDRGRAIARSLETSSGREIATLGAIRIRIPAVFYADSLRAITTFKRGAAVLQIGTFGTPARGDDVAGLTLEADDVDSLRRCRAGDCDLQLSSEAIARFQRSVPWRTVAAAAAANDVMRDVLVDLVNRYRLSGDAGLLPYADRTDRPSVSDEFRSMIASPPAVLRQFPTLLQHLMEFQAGSGQAGDVDDVIYWSKERVGPAIITSVTHLAIARLGADAPVAYAAASKQIYGSQYFDTSLGVTAIVDDTGPDGAASIILYVNRSRLDALGGFFGGLKRAIVRARSRAAMSTSLQAVRQRLERSLGDGSTLQ